MPPLPWPQDRAELTPFLPLLYVAWADGILTPTEMERIREEIARAEHLIAEDREVLERWLDPNHPPSPSTLSQLRGRIRTAARSATPLERSSLTALGMAMARAGHPGEDWGDPASLNLLEAVEEIAGVLGSEAARELHGTAEALPPLVPPTALPGLREFLAGNASLIQQRVFDLLQDPAVRVPDGLPMETARPLVLAALGKIAEAGLGGVAYPREFGGDGDVEGSIHVFEALAYGNLSVTIKFGVQFGLFGGSIAQLGTEEHHRALLPRVATLELPGIYAMTERNHGSNVREIETLARYLPETEEFEIHTPHPAARKDWLGNAALHGRMATVFVQLEVGGEEHGVHAILVPIRDEWGNVLPGIEVEDCGRKVGLNGIDNGRLSFDRVRVPRTNLLDRFGTVTPAGEYLSAISSPGRRFFTMLGTLVAGRVSIAAASVSVAKTALTIAVRYSDRRRQFGPSSGSEVPILDYLTQQRTLLPALATTYAHHFAVRELITLYAGAASDADRAHVEVLAAGLKASASRHAQDTLQACREAMGGRGYLAANRLGILREDHDIFTTFEGANVVLLQLVAKGLLTEYRDARGEPRLRGVLKLLGEIAGSEVQRRNPVRSRRTAEEFLRAPETQREALLFREERLRQTLARRLQARIQVGTDSFEAMNECQDHLLQLAQAHIDRELFEAFRRGVEGGRREGGDALGDVLEELCDLYALSVLERERGWYLESGYMEGAQAKAIRSEVNSLCRSLRASAVGLVQGFGIPEELLGAPDAFHDPSR